MQITREIVSNDLDRATENGLMEKDYVKHHFRLTKEYIYIHVRIECNWYDWSGTGLHSNEFSMALRIPTSEYSYRRLASELRKARREHDKKYGTR